MGNHVEHTRRDHAADLATGLLDALDLETELVQGRRDLVDRRNDRRELADPRERREHQYWARKRTSSSK